MSHCRRCDWRHDQDAEQNERTQLAVHAIDAEHPLCPICTRSLADLDPTMGCEHCLIDARALLSGIVTMYAELPAHLERAPGPFPGGDPLVMLSRGSQGLQETGETSRDTDPPSIAFELGWWAVAWQNDRDESTPLGHTPARVVAHASRYLEVHARWAANSFLGFPEFHADLRKLHRRLELATSHDLPEEHANADCFDCGGRLIRKADAKTGVLDVEAPMQCRSCHSTYDTTRYRLALRERWDAGVEEWLPLTLAARLVGARVETVETWAKRGQVDSACRLLDGRKVVWWPDVKARLAALEQARAQRREREAERQRRTQEAS